MKMHLKLLDQDQMDGISCVSFSRATWRNLSGPSPIQRPRLNRNDSLMQDVGVKTLVLD